VPIGAGCAGASGRAKAWIRENAHRRCRRRAVEDDRLERRSTKDVNLKANPDKRDKDIARVADELFTHYPPRERWRDPPRSLVLGAGSRRPTPRGL
jgi:hypothetical protein